MVLSYLILLRDMKKYFNGDDLAKERNRFVLVYGLILLICLIQTLYFLVLSPRFFC